MAIQSGRHGASGGYKTGRQHVDEAKLSSDTLEGSTIAASGEDIQRTGGPTITFISLGIQSDKNKKFQIW